MIILVRGPEWHNTCTTHNPEKTTSELVWRWVTLGTEACSQLWHAGSTEQHKRGERLQKPTIVSGVSRFSCGGVVMAASSTGRHHHLRLLLLLFSLLRRRCELETLAACALLCAPFSVLQCDRQPVCPEPSICAICPELRRGLSLFHCLKLLWWRLQSAPQRSHSREEPKKQTTIWSIYRHCWRMRWEYASMNHNIDVTADVYCMFNLKKGKKPNSLLIYVHPSCAICKL